MQWSDFLNLDAEQRAKLGQFGNIGTLVTDKKPVDINGMSYKDAKQMLQVIQDISKLVQPAAVGAQHVMQQLQQSALTEYDKANS